MRRGGGAQLREGRPEGKPSRGRHRGERIAAGLQDDGSATGWCGAMNGKGCLASHGRQPTRGERARAGGAPAVSGKAEAAGRWGVVVAMALRMLICLWCGPRPTAQAAWGRGGGGTAALHPRDAAGVRRKRTTRPDSGSTRRIGLGWGGGGGGGRNACTVTRCESRPLSASFWLNGPGRPTTTARACGQGRVPPPRAARHVGGSVQKGDARDGAPNISRSRDASMRRCRMSGSAWCGAAAGRCRLALACGVDDPFLADGRAVGASRRPGASQRHTNKHRKRDCRWPTGARQTICRRVYKRCTGTVTGAPRPPLW